MSCFQIAFHTYEAGNDRSELPVRSFELWQVHCVAVDDGRLVVESGDGENVIEKRWEERERKRREGNR